jgi:hypothetical protein
MGGNHKAEALAGTDLERHGQNGRLQRNLFSNPVNFDQVWSFMTPPRPECTCGLFEKHKVWLNGDTPRDIDAPARRLRLPVRPGLQSAEGRISSLSWKIIVLF